MGDFISFFNRRSVLLMVSVAAVALALGVTWLMFDITSFAQGTSGQGTSGQGSSDAAKPSARPVTKPSANSVKGDNAAKAPPVATPNTPNQPALAQNAATTVDFASRLTQAGAGGCAPQLNSLAAGTMGGVTQFDTASHWATAAWDKRLVNIAIGQKYQDGGAVPAAATNVVAVPNAQGSCDAFVVQVVPSPLPCAKIRESLSVNGRQVANLAGNVLMKDNADGGETMLVPTAANTCVLVGTKVIYSK